MHRAVPHEGRVVAPCTAEREDVRGWDCEGAEPAARFIRAFGSSENRLSGGADRMHSTRLRQQEQSLIFVTAQKLLVCMSFMGLQRRCGGFASAADAHCSARGAKLMIFEAYF